MGSPSHSKLCNKLCIDLMSFAFMTSSPQTARAASLACMNWRRSSLMLPATLERTTTLLWIAVIRTTLKPHPCSMQLLHMVWYRCTRVECYQLIPTSCKILWRVIFPLHTMRSVSRCHLPSRKTPLQCWWRQCSLSWVIDTCNVCPHWWRRYVYDRLSPLVRVLMSVLVALWNSFHPGILLQAVSGSYPPPDFDTASW